MQKLEEKYHDMNINHSEAIAIMWKKFDEVIGFCNDLQTQIDKLKEDFKKN